MFSPISKNRSRFSGINSSKRSGLFPKRGGKYEKGLTLIEVSLALIISAVVAAAAVQAKIKEQRFTTGVSQADTMKELKEAIDFYSAQNRVRIAENNAGVIQDDAGTVLVNIPNSRVPTVQNLIDGGLLPVGFPQQSLINDANYVIQLAPFPAGCVPVRCGVDGIVYLDEPLQAPGQAAGEYDGTLISAVLQRIGGDALASVINGNELVSANGARAVVNPNGNVLGTVAVNVGIPRLGSAQFDNIDVFGDTQLQNLTTTGEVVFNNDVDAGGNPVQRNFTVNSNANFNSNLTVANTGNATFNGQATFNELVTFNSNTNFTGATNNFANDSIFQRIRVTESFVSEGDFSTRTIEVRDAGGNVCIRLLENGEINVLCDGIVEARTGTFTFDDNSSFQIGQANDPATGQPSLGFRMLEPGGALRAELFSSLNPNAISVSSGQVLFRNANDGAILAAVDGVPGRQGNLIARQGLGGRALHLQRRVDGAGIDFVAGDTCPDDMNVAISNTAPFNGVYGSFIVNNSGTMLVCQNDRSDGLGVNRLVAVGNEMVGFNQACTIEGQIATLRSNEIINGKSFRQGEAMICRTAGAGVGSFHPMKTSLSRLVKEQSLVVRNGDIVAKLECGAVGGGAEGISVAYLLGQSEASADGVFVRRLIDLGNTGTPAGAIGVQGDANNGAWEVVLQDGEGNALDGGVGSAIIDRNCLY